MASGRTTKAVLGKISENHLECSICYNRFRHPKVLDCLHSFCQQCLQDLRESHDPNSDKLSCPLCRQETTLKEGKVTDLPNNFTLSALVEEIEIQEQVLKSQESQIICQSCDENHPAIAICVDCNFICEECQKAHQRMVAMKSHKIYTLAQLQSGEIDYKSKLREQVPKCVKHSDQNLSVYCNSCEQLVCTTCAVLNHEKPKHSPVDLKMAADKCKQDIKKLVEVAELKKTALNIAIKETTEYRKKLDSMFGDTNKKITAKVDKEIARIREEGKKIREELAKIYQDRVKTTDIAQSRNNKEVIKVEQKLNEINQLLAQASYYEIVELNQKLKDNLSELTEKQPEKLSDKLSLMDFEEGQRSLGRLVLKDDPKIKPKDGKWELMTEFRTFGTSGYHKQKNFKWANDVASFSNNKVVVADSEIKQFITCSLSSQSASSVMSQGLQIKGLIKPTQVSVNKDDQLIVLDDDAVKIFNREFQLHHQFTPGQRSNSRPTCIAVNDNDLIAVGYKGKDQISLHNPDGSLIKTLSAPGIEWHMAIYKQNIIYTNSGKRMLQSVDYNGRLLFSVDITRCIYQNESPIGVCCDSDGIIYVAMDMVFRGHGSIHHFSPDGTYIGCVIKDCGRYLNGLTITPDGELVLAASQSVIIYHRV